MSVAQTMPRVATDPCSTDSAWSNSGCSGSVKPLSRYPAKVWLDRIAAVVLLIFSFPLLALLMAAIRLSSRGSAVYRQTRVGKGGRIFTMYKLRSMRCDAEAGTGPVWAGAVRDCRVTPLGYWLRRLHLDELPQLVNVVRGEMALVGPRPERPEFVRVLSDQIPGYLDRLRVLPGITGLAQINLPADTDLLSVRRKLVLDLEYIDAADFVLDARIIICTFLQVLGLRGGRAVWLLGLKRVVEVSNDSPGHESVGQVTPQAIAGGETNPLDAAPQRPLPADVTAAAPIAVQFSGK